MTRGSRWIAAVLAIVSCGPVPHPEKPGGEDRFEPVPEPEVTFPENLDIPLVVPADPATLPSPIAVWKAKPAGALGLAGHLVVRVNDREGEVEALDVRNGSTVWSTGIEPCPVCAFRMTPIFDGERVIASTGSRLFALDIVGGHEQWSLELGGLPDGDGTLLEGGALVVRTLRRTQGPECGSLTTAVLVVDASAGKPLWRLEFAGLHAEPAAAGGFLHVFLSGGCGGETGGDSTGHTVRIYDIATRDLVAEEPFGEILAPPVVAGGRIVVETADSIVAMEPGSAKTCWSLPAVGASQAMVARGSTVVVGYRDRILVLDAEAGSTLLDAGLGDLLFRQGLNVLPTLAVTDGFIVVPSEPDPLRGYLAVLDARTGLAKRLLRGFGPVLQTLVWGPTAVLLLSDEIAAVDLVGEGKAERDLVPVSASVAKLVADLEEDLPFVPWSAAAEEVGRLGPAGVDALLDIAADGSLVAALVAARILAEDPLPDAVEALASFLSIPGPGADLGPVHARMIYETLRALRAAADPAASGAVASVMTDEAVDPALRSAALATLGAIAAAGDGDALAAILSLRKQAAPSGWRPCPLPATELEQEGPFLHAAGACVLGVDTPFSSSRSVATPGGEWLAYASPALGGRNDVWLARVAQGGIEGPWFTGRTVPGEIDLEFLDVKDEGTLVLESVEIECDGCYLDEEDRPKSGKPVETTLELASLRKDTDKDGWTDLVEGRLGTDPSSKDSDKDGLADAKDPAPLGSAKTSAKAMARQRILLAAVHALLAFAPSDEPLFVVGPPEANLAYWGYEAVIVHVDPERARSIQKAVGLPGPPFITFGCPLDDHGGIVPGCAAGSDPLGFVVLDASSTRASTSIVLSRSDADSALYSMDAALVSGTWIVTGLDLAGF